MSKLLILAALFNYFFLLPFYQYSNEQEQKAVQKTIEQLFDAMREGNAEGVSEAFWSNATLRTIFINKEGKPILHSDATVAEFIEAVGTPHDQVWDERISSYEIRIDGNMATAWAPYQFYVGETFSHCGVNAFQLFKGENGWKIFHIADTRRQANCAGAEAK